MRLDHEPATTGLLSRRCIIQLRLTTYKDLLDHLTDFLGANPSAEALRDARRAVQNGYRDLASRHNWSYYYARGRMTTQKPFSDGTIQYTQATRTAVLTPNTSSGFPSWAAQGTLVLTSPGNVVGGGPTANALPGNVTYKVAVLTSPTTLLLTQASNPGVDLAAGQVYTLYQDTYALPVDARAVDRLVLINNAFCLWYEHPSSWLERQRIWYGPAIPRTYTVRGSPDFTGALAISFFPAPDDVYAFDYIYQRRPRPLIKDASSTGSVSVSTGSLTVTGAGTAWESSLIGSVIRVGSDNLNLPTGLAGSYPASYERIITAVASTTSLTVDASFDQTLGPLKYLISDPVDVEELAMLTALFRSVEFQVSMSRNKKDREVVFNDYKRALIEAMEADSRNFAMESSGAQRMYPYRLAQMPRGPDIS